LGEQNIEKEQNLNMFVKEMNEMLETHEKINNEALTLNLENEEGKNEKSKDATKQISHKPSKHTLINSNNLSFKVLPNPSNKIQPPSKNFYINQANSASKINYAFNKNNTGSANIFKQKNLN